MVNSLTFRNFLTLTSITLISLLSGTNSFAAENSDDKYESKVPVVTTAEKSLGFWDLPHLKSAYISLKPEDRNDGLVVGNFLDDLVVEDANKKMIAKLAQEIADDNHGDYDSLLIAQKDKLLFESYYKRGRINLPHFQNSATKGQTALILGRAMQLGYLSMADLDKPIVSFLKDLDSTKFVKGAKDITLHDALTMSSGLRFSDEQMKSFRENPEQYKA